MTALIKLILENETPVFLGSYDTQFHIEDAFRLQSLKGLWRYWLRAYIAGAMYELGLLRSVVRRGNMLATATEESLNTLLRLTQNILGGTERASRLRLVLEGYYSRGYYTTGYHRIDKVQRVRLLTIPERRVYYARQLKVNISLNTSLGITERELGESEIKLAIGSLLTGLTLSGIGKMSRRGVGTFKVTLVDNIGVFKKFLKRDGALDLNRIKDILKYTLDSAKNYVRSHVQKEITGGPNDLPPLGTVSEYEVPLGKISLEKQPSFLSESYKVPVFIVYSVKFDKHILDVVTELQDFFYRPGRIRRIYGSPIARTEYGHAQDFITARKYSWYLGLPRTQRDTGYIPSRGIERRASPIILAVHKGLAFISVQLSSDWPRDLKWRNHLGQELPITLSRERVLKTHCEVLGYLEEYLKHLKYTPKVIYP